MSPSLRDPDRRMAVAKKPAIRRKSPLKIRRSVEYGSSIIHSLETGEPRVVYGNVENTGLITNLPAGCCVEVPCMVDKNGIQPTQDRRESLPILRP
jgi:alpha-galactosidase/6-phospho-beta-glucosidase family protein